LYARAHQAAEKAWQEVCAEGVTYSKDYQKGFKEGFADYLQYGGNGEPPSIPPRCYWNDDSVPGRNAAHDWSAGFRHGSTAAMRSGLRELIVVPLTGPGISPLPEGTRETPSFENFDPPSPLPPETGAKRPGIRDLNLVPLSGPGLSAPLPGERANGHGVERDPRIPAAPGSEALPVLPAPRSLEPVAPEAKKAPAPQKQTQIERVNWKSTGQVLVVEPQVPPAPATEVLRVNPYPRVLDPVPPGGPSVPVGQKQQKTQIEPVNCKASTGHDIVVKPQNPPAALAAIPLPRLVKSVPSVPSPGSMKGSGAQEKLDPPVPETAAKWSGVTELILFPLGGSGHSPPPQGTRGRVSYENPIPPSPPAQQAAASPILPLPK
jgi:hypothetical protein